MEEPANIIKLNNMPFSTRHIIFFFPEKYNILRPEFHKLFKQDKEQYNIRKQSPVETILMWVYSLMDKAKPARDQQSACKKKSHEQKHKLRSKHEERIKNLTKIQ